MLTHYNNLASLLVEPSFSGRQCPKCLTPVFTTVTNPRIWRRHQIIAVHWRKIIRLKFVIKNIEKKMREIRRAHVTPNSQLFTLRVLNYANQVFSGRFRRPVSHKPIFNIIAAIMICKLESTGVIHPSSSNSLVTTFSRRMTKTWPLWMCVSRSLPTGWKPSLHHRNN